MPTRSAPGVRAAKRRRDVLRLLLGFVFVTGVSALVTNANAAWAAFGVSTLALVGFGGLWAYARSVQIEQIRKVRAIPQRRPRDFPLRRAASS